MPIEKNGEVECSESRDIRLLEQQKGNKMLYAILLMVQNETAFIYQICLTEVSLLSFQISAFEKTGFKTVHLEEFLQE